MYTLNFKSLALFAEEIPTEDRIILGTVGSLGGLGFVTLAYPIYRGVACYMGQAEHLRSSFNPVSISRKQLKTSGALHSSFQILGAGGGFKALYYGLTPLLLCTPIAMFGFTCAASTVSRLNGSEGSTNVWKEIGIYSAIIACSEIACAPFRNLHLAMATYPSNEPYPRPTMRQLLKKHPHMWRAGIFPFMTSAIVASFCHFSIGMNDIFGEDPTPVIYQGDEEDEPATLGSLSFIGVGALAAHIAYLVGIRNVVDFTRHETISVPKYTSWTQPWKFQFKSGWRTLTFGIAATAGLQIAFGFSNLIPQLVGVALKEYGEALEAEQTSQSTLEDDRNEDTDA